MLYSTFFIKFLIWITFLNTPLDEGLHVKIVGIKTSKGKIMVGVYKNDGGFPKVGREFKGYEIRIKNNNASILIKDLAKGTYAIGVCHDINDNDKLDKNFFGIPQEPYGFSKNIRGYMSAPSFEEVSFYYDGSLDLEIKVEGF
jgi:uncharacterized protein (DUF2141 family)